MAKAHLKLVSPARVYRTVPPKRKPNATYRTHEHLSEGEVDRLIKAAKKNRHGLRDSAMIFIAFRHGLRAAEVVDLRWDQVDFEQRVLHVRRVKRGTPATHPLDGEETRALRQLKRLTPGQYVFVSERGEPFSTAGFAKMIERAGEAAGIPNCHPHQLRHACGYALANKGTDTRTLQAYLGHRSIEHTVRYTELAPDRFTNIWRES
jgi:integrase